LREPRFPGRWNGRAQLRDVFGRNQQHDATIGRCGRKVGGASGTRRTRELAMAIDTDPLQGRVALAGQSHYERVRH
jgi:hypothetical protein